MYKFLKISDRKGLITYFLVCIIVLSFIGILNQFSLSVPEDLKNSLGTKFYTTALKHSVYIIGGLCFLFIVLMLRFDYLSKIYHLYHLMIFQIFLYFLYLVLGV